MNCQGCLRSEARYRFYTDILNLEVCTPCAIKIIDIENAVEVPGSQTDRQLGEGLNPHGVLTGELTDWTVIFPSWKIDPFNLNILFAASDPVATS
ncbi:MAG: hypothetical protein ACE5FB_07955 [Candidatus Binatia bacterium]